MENEPTRPLYILLISVHGLIRGHSLELGRDADTGGQTKYVVELSRALARHPKVERVELLTRRIVDPEVSDDYAEPFEALTENARIVRLPAGPLDYLPKETLWDHLDGFADHTLSYLGELGVMPDVIHSHYADAGYVGMRLSNILGVPLVHTGHSLGRVKRMRLLAAGVGREQIESRYAMSRRIKAEEDVLASADLVVASTHNEIGDQYRLYDYYQPERMVVIPPGVDLDCFHPPDGGERMSDVAADILRFLSDPDKPLILALSRPDERKNIGTLVEAYGESSRLRDAANLCIVAGNRDDIREMPPGSQSVLTDLLLLIDRYDLYGCVAYPKNHRAEDVPVFYRLAASLRGVFVNVALTEPFGLTLLEAAASGLPLVATEDGGPRDIVANCQNGLLVDPLDKEAIADALLTLLEQPDTRQAFVDKGIASVKARYSWEAHARVYVNQILPLVSRAVPIPPAEIGHPALYRDRAIFTDLDQNLLGDPDSLREFTAFLRSRRNRALFGIATGRRLDSALKILKRHDIPTPDVLITSVGTEIHYSPELTSDTVWTEHIDHLWNPKALRRLLDPLPGLELQPKSKQTRFKLSYYIDPTIAPSLDEIQRLLHQAEQTVNTILSFGQFLDVLPVRASKGLALRYFAHHWGIPLEHVLAAGGSGADEDMMRGNTLAVIVAHRHHEELSQLTDADRIYFAKQPYAKGILEAIDYYDFFGRCRVPDQ